MKRSCPVITQTEFDQLAAQGYNRIPLSVEAFADLETPLSLYLKLAHTSAASPGAEPAAADRREGVQHRLVEQPLLAAQRLLDAHDRAALPVRGEVSNGA